MSHARFISLLLSVPLALAAGCTRDLRPEPLASSGLQPEAAARGRALLERARVAHGGQAAFERQETMRVTFRDAWRGTARLVNPWPEAEVRARVDLARGRLRATAEFLEGDEAGTRWGIDDGRTWIAPAGGAAVDDDDEDVRFILAALQFLFQLPFRVGEAPFVADAGRVTVRDRPYDRVFATWVSPEPNTDADQFVVYLDPDSGRVAMAHFTVRQLARFVESTVHFEDLREHDGLALPHQLSMTDAPEDDPAAWIRRLTVESLALDTTPLP